MRSFDNSNRRLIFLAGLTFAFLTLLGLVIYRPVVQAQEPEDGSATGGPSAMELDAGDEGGAATPPVDRPAAEEAEGLNVFTLLVRGGVFMIPLLAVSILMLTFMIERFIALRRQRILPGDLVTGLGQLGGSQGGFDPRRAYRLCQEHPSAASNVIRAMLLKVGRPHSEVEHAVAESSEREADRLYSNVRWLTLVAAIAPLLGLLGTVWGMIMAFHDTSLLDPGQNKAEELARGIYTALVTTLTGLSIAIPSAIFAHYFEGRITTLFHQVDELLFNLLPQVERYEGRVRFGRQMGEQDGGGAPAKAAEAEAVGAGAAPSAK